VQGYGIWRLKTLALLAKIVDSIQPAIDKLVVFQAVWLIGSISRLIQQALLNNPFLIPKRMFEKSRTFALTPNPSVLSFFYSGGTPE
jgi:hypothetical protein